MIFFDTRFPGLFTSTPPTYLRGDKPPCRWFLGLALWRRSPPGNQRDLFAPFRAFSPSVQIFFFSGLVLDLSHLCFFIILVEFRFLIFFTLQQASGYCSVAGTIVLAPKRHFPLEILFSVFVSLCTFLKVLPLFLLSSGYLPFARFFPRIASTPLAFPFFGRTLFNLLPDLILFAPL